MSWHARVQARAGAFVLDVDLTQAAPVTAIVGPNGSGKTTLLRAMAGLVECEVADVRIGGAIAADSAAHVNLPTEARRIGYVPQSYGLFTHLTVVENVAFGLAYTDPPVPRRDRLDRAWGALRELDCDDLAERLPAGLSGGECQRVALARALVVEPELLLLDEPLSALDAVTRVRVRSILAARLSDFGRPAIVSTHDVRDAEALDAHIVVMEDGRVVQTGSLAEVRAHPRTPFAAAFATG